LTDPQRRVIATACYAVAGILFLFYFLRPFWAWASWDQAKNTLDLGFVKFTNRPEFPDDPRAILVGLVIPIVLVAAGRLSARTERQS
jgi:hypothetical protein